jgi:hypothetical protein
MVGKQQAINGEYTRAVEQYREHSKRLVEVLGYDPSMVEQDSMVHLGLDKDGTHGVAMTILVRVDAETYDRVIYGVDPEAGAKDE